MRARIWQTAFVACLALPGLPRQAAAQAVFEQFNLQFSFATPGARAKGMGGAFVAIADDASASEMNPGGLALALRPNRRELSLELSSSRPTTHRLAAADSFETGMTDVFGERQTALGFASIAFKTKSISWTLFTQNFLDYRESFRLALRRVPGTNHAFLPLRGDIDFDGRSYGAAAGARLGSRLGVGASFRLLQLDFRTLTERGDVFLPDVITNVQEIEDTDWGVGGVAGILWTAYEPAPGVGADGQPAAPPRNRPRLTLGANYVFNPSFGFVEQFDELVGDERRPVPGFPRTLNVSIPDRLSVGMAAHWPQTGLLASAQLDWDQYSELGGGRSNLIPDVGEFRGAAFRVRDVVSVRAGAEYERPLGTLSLIRVRGGVFSAPSHGFRYTGELDTSMGRAMDRAFNMLGEETRVGWSAGLGFRRRRLSGGDVAVVRDAFTINLAYQRTPGLVSEFVASLAAAF
jgi:hypothetical protein